MKTITITVEDLNLLLARRSELIYWMAIQECHPKSAERTRDHAADAEKRYFAEYRRLVGEL